MFLRQLITSVNSYLSFPGKRNSKQRNKTRQDMSVNTLWKGEMGWREILTPAGLPGIPVVSLGADWNTHAGVGENQAGVAGRAGEWTPTGAGFTGGVTSCKDSRNMCFCTSKSRSPSKFQKLLQTTLSMMTILSTKSSY